MTDLDGQHRVQSLVTKPAIAVHLEDTLRRTAETLTNNDIGVALVQGPERAPAGLVSERDIVRAIADGSDLDLTRVDDVMTVELVTVERGTDLREAASLMIGAGVRHLVVMDGDAVFGVVSERDALHEVLRGD